MEPFQIPPYFGLKLTGQRNTSLLANISQIAIRLVGRYHQLELGGSAMPPQMSSSFHGNATQFQPVEATFAGAVPNFENGSLVLDRLVKALVEAGVNPDKLDRREENTKRLAIVARLFELPVSASVASESVPKRAPSALPKCRLKRVTEYVENHISDQITLAELASTAGMSRMYFASQFKAATGMRPHDYVLRKRIERAQHLLLNTSESLVEIALGVGFQTQAHFTTIFKKIAGNTPLRWRREQQL